MIDFVNIAATGPFLRQLVLAVAKLVLQNKAASPLSKQTQDIYILVGTIYPFKAFSHFVIQTINASDMH